MGSKRPKMDIPSSSEEDEDVECPVCFQVPRGNIYQCCNGHHICDDCSTKVTNCPTCRSAGVRIRNRFAERLLNAKEFPCSWSEQGCDEMMKRGQLSAHEDLCDLNPDIVDICSLFWASTSCKFRISSKWLSDPENCTEFIQHVESHSYPGNQNLRVGQKYHFTLGFQNTLSDKPIEDRPMHHYYGPFFGRLASRTRGDEDQLIFRIILVKVDKLGNKLVSFPHIQLTPETTQLVVKYTIDGKPDPEMVSKWGEDSLSSLSWTQKVIGIKQFMEMVGTSPKTEAKLPFSFPASFLSEYYVGEDKILNVNCSYEQIS